MNSKIDKKDLNLIKAALRRAFARSSVHKRLMDAANCHHVDLSRPKVKGWRRCSECKKPEARSYCVLDHKIPVVPVDSALEFMTPHQILDAIWCVDSNLSVLCPTCHDAKTLRETQLRKENKRRIKLLSAEKKRRVINKRKRK